MRTWRAKAALARDALDKVVTYFGKAPFSNYTVALEFLQASFRRGTNTASAWSI